MDSEITIFDYNSSKLSGVALDIYLKVPRLEQGKVSKYNKDTNDDFNQKLIMSGSLKTTNYRTERGRDRYLKRDMLMQNGF